MGGKPVLAIAILGWPVNKIPPEVAQKVLEGARAVCAEAGITLAGGHSIDSPEPVFGPGSERDSQYFAVEAKLHRYGRLPLISYQSAGCWYPVYRPKAG